MIGFVTASGTHYYINQLGKFFFTDKNPQPISYIDLSAIIGDNAYIRLIDGSVLRTNIVVSYL